ncbi:MAG: hypothetical protein O8C61_07150 [Candidatus Methanoperedens sp.]|nr:hypothetical protein [Candidatus Methanoperedens sp.]
MTIDILEDRTLSYQSTIRLYSYMVVSGMVTKIVKQRSFLRQMQNSGEKSYRIMKFVIGKTLRN